MRYDFTREKEARHVQLLLKKLQLEVKKKIKNRLFYIFLSWHSFLFLFLLREEVIFAQIQCVPYIR